jgi:hypothetical protein
MRFSVPDGSEFEIPDDWWSFAEMDKFSPAPGGFYVFPFELADDVTVVFVSDVEPPKRNPGVQGLKKHKLMPVLFAMADPQGVLPPIPVTGTETGSRYRFRALDGYHRYYASVAVGYTKLPVIIHNRVGEDGL